MQPIVLHLPETVVVERRQEGDTADRAVECATDGECPVRRVMADDEERGDGGARKQHGDDAEQDRKDTTQRDRPPVPGQACVHGVERQAPRRVITDGGEAVIV